MICKNINKYIETKIKKNNCFRPSSCSKIQHRAKPTEQWRLTSEYEQPKMHTHSNDI